MALVDWTEQQIEEFLRMQFKAQHTFYHEQFSNAQFDIIEFENASRKKESQIKESIGRLYVDRRADEIRIIDIALLPGHRGKGIGASLMRSLINEASGSDRSVSIHVEHNNPAMKLYRRLGFRHVRDEGVYYFMRWNSVDETAELDQENTAS